MEGKMKEYNMMGRDIGIVVRARSAEEAMEIAERELLQGLGGYIEFLNEEDQEEYENKE